MNKKEFFDYCGKNYDQNDCQRFLRAVELIETSFSSKKRLADDTFFDHNLRVGYILLENKFEPNVVLAGLLHGLDEEKIVGFGKEVTMLVKGVADLRSLKIKNTNVAAEALRKIILTTLKDVRVIFIKLANKLDNLRTIKPLSKEEQKRIAEEVLEIYSPLASRLGLEKLKTQLEDLSLRILKPKIYRDIVTYLKESSEERESDVNLAISMIKDLAKHKVDLIKIKGRPKHIYSIYLKIVKRGVKLDDQYDLLGIRAIVKDVKSCYTLLGLLHEKFDPIPGKLKDYIANPKPNLYRSIHTALILPNKKIIEIQIRTKEMDEFAEEGPAAHWDYKGIKSDVLFEKRTAWLKGVLDLQKEGKNKDFLEAVKVDIFGDKIFCYTPQGDVKELPSGATILDFAYSVHEEIGNKSVGGRVNGVFVPLRHKLKLGDIVEILTNKNQRPRRTWLKFIKSSRAKQKIRKSLREHEKLPALHYHKLKPLQKEELGVLTEAKDFPRATCILAKCCQAIPGDKIVGIITKRRIISVHKEVCRLAQQEEKRWIPVNWKDTFNQRIKFTVHADERSGLLADLLNTIASTGFEVKEAKAKLLGNDAAECSFVVIPRDLQELKKLIKRVKKVKGIKWLHFN